VGEKREGGDVFVLFFFLKASKSNLCAEKKRTRKKTGYYTQAAIHQKKGNFFFQWASKFPPHTHTFHVVYAPTEEEKTAGSTNYTP